MGGANNQFLVDYDAMAGAVFFSFSRNVRPIEQDSIFRDL